MKQLEVQIMGNSYLLGCPEGGEARLMDAVSKVDAAMCKIRDAGKIKARDRIAVLAALNLAFDSVAAPTSADTSTPTATPAASSAPTSAPNAVPGSGGQLMDPDTLRSLLERLDAVLSEDGQLI
jgi:cell division protein ZapA